MITPPTIGANLIIVFLVVINTWALIGILLSVLR